MSAWRTSEDHERFHIDSGPRINALQVISEALDIPQQQDDTEDSLAGSPPEDLTGHPTHLNNPDDSGYPNPASLLGSPPGTGPPSTKTIVAADGDVSNGFVMAGRNLPYVFEASDSGIRKRSSKILPVCAVCNKRFVCVTTMKRHLVTHTGEKPFCCKVCGKQYTQKGNLRVHERTHRNDRPFECNICHQKFYRKEPMQKHQWRQHGVVHFKTRPTSESSTSSTPTPDIQNTCPPLASTPVTIIQQPQQVTVSNLSSTLANSIPATPLSIEQPNPLIALRPARPTSYTALVDSLRAINRDTSPYRSDPPPIAPPTAHQIQIDVPKYSSPSISSPAPVLLQSLNVPQQLQAEPSKAPLPPVVVVKLPLKEQLEFKHAKCSSSSQTASESSSFASNTTPTGTIGTSSSSSSIVSPPNTLSSHGGINPPSAHANASSTSITIKNEPAQLSVIKEESASNFSYSSILNETPNTHLLNVPAATTIEPVIQQASQASSSSSSSSSSQSTTTDQGPIKLKMKMAYQAYQAQEQQEQQLQSQEHESVHEQYEQQEHQVVHNLDNDLNEMKLGANEMVECQCKTCGNVFSVVDPYNFRCNNCNVKYTSLPTHLIADPLQCIGCCVVFPHKPALKAHQTVSDKERPFRCCKCGYGFRQKAHLQKHQWRIHRRKLEPDPNMKEAEAFFEVIRSSGSSTSATASNTPAATPNPAAGGAVSPSTTITMQDIINKSVEKSIGEGPRNLMKTSSKYYSEVLGLEYEPKSSTSSDDDDSRDQPLDLSPAKKLASRENNPLLNQPPLPSINNSQQQQFQSSNNSNSNQTINQEQLSVEQQSTNNHDQYPGTWKKQKITSSSSSSPSSIATHSTLPPISGLQKPMSLVTVKNPYKHSSWISTGSNSVSQSNPQSTDGRPSSHLNQPIELVNRSSKNSSESNFIRSQMELLKSGNGRTV